MSPQIRTLHRAWRPLLEGEALERAELRVWEIGRALCEAPPPPTPGLAGGAAGIGLFCAYLDRCRPELAARECAGRRLDQATDSLAEEVMYPSFYGGFTGIAWAHLRAQTLLNGADSPDDADAIDEALLEILAESPWPHDYELVRGLVGFGIYWLERWPRPAAASGLEAVVRHLAERAETRGTEICWHTPPRLLLPHQRRETPDGYYNLGVAHGIPGVIALLAGIVAAGAGDEAADVLLRGALRWLLDRRLSGGAEGAYAHFAGVPGEDAPARLAWCYGDAGIAGVLAAAATALDDPALLGAALDIGRLAARRSTARSGVADAGLCHGSAGLGHIFNRLYQSSGDELFREAARRWIVRTLDYHRPGEGVGGYLAWQSDMAGNSFWQAEPGLLEGAAGIGAALLAASSDVPPDWDRFLLLSLAAPRGGDDAGSETASRS